MQTLLDCVIFWAPENRGIKEYYKGYTEFRIAFVIFFYPRPTSFFNLVVTL